MEGKNEQGEVLDLTATENKILAEQVASTFTRNPKSKAAYLTKDGNVWPDSKKNFAAQHANSTNQKLFVVQAPKAEADSSQLTEKEALETGNDTGSEGANNTTGAAEEPAGSAAAPEVKAEEPAAEVKTEEPAGETKAEEPAEEVYYFDKSHEELKALCAARGIEHKHNTSRVTLTDALLAWDAAHPAQ